MVLAPSIGNATAPALMTTIPTSFSIFHFFTGNSISIYASLIFVL